jgi:hypothetical protein
MKIPGVLTCLMLACAMPVAHAQTPKPELEPIDFNKLDSNHDGKLSQSEAKGVPELLAEFAALDVNHDGFLSVQEFEMWPRAKKSRAQDPGTVPGGSNGAQHMPKG